MLQVFKTNFAGRLILSHICISGGHFQSLGKLFTLGTFSSGNQTIVDAIVRVSA